MKSKTDVKPVAASETRLAIPLLCDLWFETQMKLAGANVNIKERWEEKSRMLDMLGLGLEETINMLYREQPSYETFENWILEKNGGLIDPVLLNFIRTGEYEDSTVWAETANVLSESDLDFFDRNGYVVLRNAVPAEQCRSAEEVVWKFLEKDPHKPETWYVHHSKHKGIWVHLYQHPVLQVNRQSARIRKAFEQLYGTSALWVSTNKTGFNPPETETYHFQGTRLHWDVSLKLPIPFELAGILYLTDVEAHQGAFSCVPGFHKRIASWLAGLPEGANPREIALNELEKEAVPVAGRAGDLVIWQQALPHAATANRAHYPRIVQYISWRALVKQQDVWI